MISGCRDVIIGLVFVWWTSLYTAQ